ncbi:hypothetical protein [Legionella tunisiensis]|nr:hypothetical protein [Legionella tunisiensis]
MNLFVTLSDEKMQEQRESGGVFTLVYRMLHAILRMWTSQMD